MQIRLPRRSDNKLQCLFGLHGERHTSDKSAKKKACFICFEKFTVEKKVAKKRRKQTMNKYLKIMVLSFIAIPFLIAWALATQEMRQKIWNIMMEGKNEK